MHDVYNGGQPFGLVENDLENGEEEQKFRWEVRDTNTPVVSAKTFYIKYEFVLPHCNILQQ